VAAGDCAGGQLSGAPRGVPGEGPRPALPELAADA